MKRAVSGGDGFAAAGGLAAAATSATTPKVAFVAPMIRSKL